METYFFPDIGGNNILDLGTGDLLVPVKKAEPLGYLEIAIRIKKYITVILRHAV